MSPHHSRVSCWHPGKLTYWLWNNNTIETQLIITIKNIAIIIVLRSNVQTATYMLNIKTPATLTGAGLISAIAASLCCITPVVALVAGSSSLAASFSWLEPARPFLVGLSLGVLALAWYFKVKPVTSTNKECCETTKKTSFFQSQTFLLLVTLFALLMMAFPLYANLFYSKPKTQVASITPTNSTQQAIFTIQGMSCAGCEEHVNKELSKENGVAAFTTSYLKRSSLVSFDNSKTGIKTIEAAINRSGYKVKSYELITTPNTLNKNSPSCSKGSGKSCCEKAQ
jgi:mercuric ion transport protein